jgi:hypothetical protein
MENGFRLSEYGEPVVRLAHAGEWLTVYANGEVKREPAPSDSVLIINKIPMLVEVVRRWQPSP